MAGRLELSDEEAASAAEAATADERVKGLTSERLRVVSVTPVVPPRGAPPGPPQAVVGIYDHTNSRSVVAVVDLESNAVTEARITPAQFQLHPDERVEAEGLAAADERVQAFLVGREMHPLTRLYFPTGRTEADGQHRFAIVFLRPSNRERLYAVVDLTEGAVVDVFGPDVISPQ